MLKKSYSKTGRSCRVTFKVPAESKARHGAVLGEFNAWDAAAHPLKKRKDGSLSTTVHLDAGQRYRFRYLLDDRRWENDEAADGFVPNRFGTTDCLLSLEETPSSHHG